MVHGIVRWFAAGLYIVPDSVFLHDEPKGDDGEPLEEELREKVRRVVWAMLHTDDPGIFLTHKDDAIFLTSHGLAQMMAVGVMTCQEFGLTVSESNAESVRL